MQMLGASVGNILSCGNGEPTRGVDVSGRGHWRWAVLAGPPPQHLLVSRSQGEDYTY